MKSTSRNHWFLMVGLLLIVALMASRHLFHNLLWFDERLSIYHTAVLQSPVPLEKAVVDSAIATNALALDHEGGIGSIVERSLRVDRHPPFYYLTLRNWFEAFGVTAFSGRLLSMFAGLLAIALTYRLGRDLSGSNLVALGGAVALGLSSLWVHQMHELRMYTFIALLAVAGMWLYWRSMVRLKVDLLTWVGLGISLWLLAMTYYLGAVFCGVLGIYHLLFGRQLARDRMRWRCVMAVLVMTALFLVPWYALWLASTGTRTTAVFETAGGMSVAFLLVESISFLGNDFPALFLMVLIMALILARGRGFGFVAYLAVVTYVILAIVSQTVSEFYSARNLMIIWPALALVAGYGIQTFKRLPYVPQILIVAMFVVGLVSSWDMSRLAVLSNPAYVSLPLPERTLALCSLPDEPLYMTQAARETNTALIRLLPYFHDGQGREAMPADTLAFNADTVWYMSLPDDTPPVAPAGYSICTQHVSGSILSTVYVADGATCPVTQRPDVPPACARLTIPG